MWFVGKIKRNWKTKIEFTSGSSAPAYQSTIPDCLCTAAPTWSQTDFRQQVVAITSRLSFFRMFVCPLPGSWETGLLSGFIMHNVPYGSTVAGKKTNRCKGLQSIMQVKYWYTDKMWQPRRATWGFVSCPVPGLFKIVLCSITFPPKRVTSRYPRYPIFEHALHIRLMWLKCNWKGVIFNTHWLHKCPFGYL